MDPPPSTGATALIAISVGNTRTQVGLFTGDQLERVERFPNSDLDAVVGKASEWWSNSQVPDGTVGVLLASVNDPTADKLAGMLESTINSEVFRVGDDVPIPIGTQLDPETITGVDRLLNAAAAYERLKQACVIVDAGTAVTIDFVDGQGTFHGGAIAPGAAMQLRSLHEHTVALPEVSFRTPDAEAFGRNTTQAMLQGVFHGIRGMVQRLVEQYAEAFGAFPVVIATGGDAQTLFGNDELIDRIVPELTLMGIAAAAKHALADGSTGTAGEE